VVDHILRALWRGMGDLAGVSLVAVGGYGRGELYPHSDVDLLILLPDVAPAALEAEISELVSTLWDIGLDIGHSARTIRECVEEATRDITVQTNLMEARFLAGDREHFRVMQRTLRECLDREAFFTAKKLEQESRYARYQDTAFSLEPNCKESPGGLRDLQSIRWIAQGFGIGPSWSGLLIHQVCLPEELRAVRQAEAFLRELRVSLHYLAKRREDRLLFDHQEALAKDFGITAGSHQRASEILMQRYYRNAKIITQLNTMLVQKLGATFAPRPFAAPVPINARFLAKRDLLDIASDDIFEQHPAAILESFAIMQRHSELKGMSARTLRGLWAARRLITPAFRSDPAHRALFMQILRAPRGLIHELRRMNQFDILGRYLPAWGKIVGRMQHDLFHVYTVDQHILQVVRNVRRFTMTEHAHEYPLMSRLMSEFRDAWLLYIAAMFHDIAKGRGGDHSLLGMQDADAFCTDHGLCDEDRALVVWLVEHHLTMSSVAQKQDLSEPAVIERFARIVGSERRLVALYLLTHADIRGTSPKVWNAWKGKLLEDLFFATQALLRGHTPLQASGIAQRQEEARGILRFHGLREGVENALWETLDTSYFMRFDAQDIAWHARMLYHRPESPSPIVRARPNQIGQGVQVMVFTPDQKDLFLRILGFFARLGFSVADAKIFTTRHGYALDSFNLLDLGHADGIRDVVGLLEHDLAERLAHPGLIDEPMKIRLSRQQKHFPIEPEVSIRPDDRNQRFILSVSAADRPGLLFSVAKVLALHQINLHAAKIATLGERVEDTFLLSGEALHREDALIRIERDLLESLAI
jgi:[protein-PII] uridylyltransferase